SDALKGGSNQIVNNYGRIVITPEPGQYNGQVWDMGGGENNTFHNFAGGFVEGSNHALTGEADINVINDAGGTIIGLKGSAVNMDNDPEVEKTAHITNRGTMEGRSANLSDSDGDAVDVDGFAIIDNYGTISGLGHNGYHKGEPNVSEGVAIGGGTINNYAG